MNKQNLFLSKDVIGKMAEKQFREDIESCQHSFRGIVKIHPQTGKTVFMTQNAEIEFNQTERK